MIDEQLPRFLDSLPARPWLLGLGEPTHRAEAFLTLRNEIFRWLVEHEGYRAIAIESDCLAGLAVDEFVDGCPRSLDEVMATGFSHGFGASAANRELVAWMRQHNEHADPAARLRFHGFDGPTEMMYAPSPRGPMAVVRAYLAEHLDDAALVPHAMVIDDLAGADARWSDEAAMLDPSRSVGASADAVALRLLADDLLALLEAEAPGLIAATSRAEWERAHLHGRTATGLLRYHAGMADPSEARLPALMYWREVMMAANLRAIAERGPTLVFAQNRHLQKAISTMEFGGLQRWWSAGAIFAATTHHRYAFLATAVGSIPARGLGTPPPDTVEGVLAALPAGIHSADEVRAALQDRAVLPRMDVKPEQGYLPLDPHSLDGADGVVFVPMA